MLPYSPCTKPLGCQLHPSSPHPPPLATLQVSCYGGCINRDLTRQRPFRILSKCGNTIDLKYDMTRKYKLSCHASVHECCCKWLIPPCMHRFSRIEQSCLTRVALNGQCSSNSTIFTAENEHFFTLGLCIYSKLNSCRVCEREWRIYRGKWSERLLEISKVQ